MASNLIPEPNMQASNIPTGGAARVAFSMAPSTNVFAKLSKTIAAAGKTITNFSELEERENKSKRAWQEQLEQIHGLTQSGELSEQDYMKIQREANAKAQKEGIIRAHENWSTMTEVSKERMRILTNSKSAYFEKRLGQLSNPDSEWREEYDVVESEFNDEYADVPVGVDSQGNPVFSNTSRMSPMELVEYSKTHTIHRQATEMAIRDIAHKRSLQASKTRGQQAIAESYRGINENSPGGIRTEYITMPSIDSRTGKRFSSFAEQFGAATERGEVIYNASLGEAEAQAQSRSDLLGHQLDMWEEINKKSAYFHPTTGRPIYYNKEGEPYSEISETFLSPGSEAFLGVVSNEVSKMRDAGVTDVGEVVMTTISSIVNSMAEEASLGDSQAPKKISDLVTLMQSEFSHMSGEDGERILFAPEGTKNHEKLNAVRAKALLAYSKNQEALSSHVGGELALIRETFRRTIRQGMSLEERNSMTYDTWLRGKLSEASDNAALVRGFDDQDGLLGDLTKIADKLSSDSANTSGVEMNRRYELRLRRATNLTLTDNDELDNIEDWITTYLHTGEGDNLSQQQYNSLVETARKKAKSNDARRANSDNPQTQTQLDAKAAAYSDVDSSGKAVNTVIRDLYKGLELAFIKSETEIVDFDIVLSEAKEFLSSESNEMYSALNGQGLYKLDSGLKYLDEAKGTLNREFAQYLLLNTTMDWRELQALQENLMTLRQGVEFSSGNLNSKVTQYTNAMSVLERYTALSSLYAHENRLLGGSENEDDFLNSLGAAASTQGRKVDRVNDTPAVEDPNSLEYNSRNQAEAQGSAAASGGGVLGAKPIQKGKDPSGRNYFLNPEKPNK